jgi:methyl-accepting chemotaxis protein
MNLNDNYEKQVACGIKSNAQAQQSATYGTQNVAPAPVPDGICSLIETADLSLERLVDAINTLDSQLQPVLSFAHTDGKEAEESKKVCVPAAIEAMGRLINRIHRIGAHVEDLSRRVRI